MSTALVTICDKLSFYFGRRGKDRHVWMFGKVWNLKIQNKNDENIFKVLNTKRKTFYWIKKIIELLVYYCF